MTTRWVHFFPPSNNHCVQRNDLEACALTVIHRLYQKLPVCYSEVLHPCQISPSYFTLSIKTENYYPCIGRVVDAVLAVEHYLIGKMVIQSRPCVVTCHCVETCSRFCIVFPERNRSTKEVNTLEFV